MRVLQSSGWRCLQRLTHLATIAPWLTVLVAIAAAGAGLWYTVEELRFQTSRNALVSPRAPYIQLKDEVENDFGETDYIVVVVEPPHLARGKQYVQTLATRLRADTQHFKTVP